MIIIIMIITVYPTLTELNQCDIIDNMLLFYKNKWMTKVRLRGGVSGHNILPDLICTKCYTFIFKSLLAFYYIQSNTLE